MKYIESSSHFEIGMYVFRQKLLSETDPSTYGRTQNLGVEMDPLFNNKLPPFYIPKYYLSKKSFQF